MSSSSNNTCCLHCLHFVTEVRKKKLINALYDPLIQNAHVTISQHWITLLSRPQPGSSEQVWVFEPDQTLFSKPNEKEKEKKWSGHMRLL